VLGYDDATTSALRLSGFLLHYAPRKLVLTRTLEAVTLPGQGLIGAFLERFHNRMREGLIKAMSEPSAANAGSFAHFADRLKSVPFKKSHTHAGLPKSLSCTRLMTSLQKSL